jgi:hypothetical protein
MSYKMMLFVVMLQPGLVFAACISPNQAGKYVGETKCVSGKALRVEEGSAGEHYLEFCRESTSCSFAAVVFPEDLRHIGDVSQLAGKFIEVHGDVKDRNHGPEIVVSEAWQLKGEAASIPPLSKNYDVEKKGHYSAGVFSHPESYSTTKKRQTAKLPMNIPQDPED